jgi:hypothetical protein
MTRELLLSREKQSTGSANLIAKAQYDPDSFRPAGGAISYPYCHHCHQVDGLTGSCTWGGAIGSRGAAKSFGTPTGTGAPGRGRKR